MSDTQRLHPQLLRGLQLKDLGRYADAEGAFREALAQEPNNAFALHQLAACQFHLPAKHREALDTVQGAIALEPEECEHHVLRSFILCLLERPQDALRAAETALGFDPFSSPAFTAQAQAQLLLEKWSAAEQSARQALAIDGDNSIAANQLAQALRLQNKLAENDAHLQGMLARDPEDAFTHANAGWSALQRGKHREAETHFREALRLNPEFEQAREGLLNSFRARSPIYRAYLRYCFAMQRLSSRARWAVVIGLVLASHLTRWLPGPLGVTLIALYFLFVLWIWVAKPAGNFFLLFDRFARFALRRSETLEAAVVGGGLLFGLATLVSGLVFAAPMAQTIGIGLIASAFPLAMTFTNGSRLGAWLFGSIGGMTLLATLLCLLSDYVSFISPAFAANLLWTGWMGCLLCTWLGNIPSLRKPA